ncbi:MAG: dTMP kinase [Deltaproteobacteria bacterium GWA2_38_16]|nr:MAG: dTMP kinase [Deltaproteobacteria bacterium GWA2_38_16]OGQ02233.1 MAG: dTMP kinase [Deltaproteobacteria bacterium RIFCSPHIGHO2_02_FULL_38_15]OGQ34176.1 MAG: dTMP kinase [Deltaproteobacteria bacterium RIFCSPLOWO2_01_FULL_38_9]OGQ61025.1 MAG: dTMP kinase [Deltaproteobacteria bacterium RIFCSPLOWO2_12_FULL_38_8]HBQ21780.1 dTMP kinase [Deltaproteobacteria bacterium]
MSLFITFEGGEGSGKTTQINLLKKVLQKKDHHVLITREPGGTTIGDQIRHILLDPKNKKMVPLTELLLYEAGRSQHVQEKILAALKKNIVVISDRYADASTVYQGYARKLSSNLVSKLNAIATSDLKPDLTIILDCPPKDGLKRVKESRHRFDRIEKEKKSFHDAIRKGYLKLAKSEPRRVKIVNALGSKKEIHEQILKLVFKKI